MKDQLFFSNQKKTATSTILSATAGGEDSFLWGLADLLTLLLIFFIFLYAQSSGQSLSTVSTTAAAPGVAIAEPAVHTTSALPEREASHAFQSLAVRPVIVQPFIDAKKTTDGVVSSEGDIPEPIEEDQRTAPPEVTPAVKEPAPMEFLRQEALSAIQEAEDPSCSIRWNQNRLVFILGERLTFPVGEAQLLTGFYPTMERIARLIAAKKDYRVMVSGHTDDTPIETPIFPSNWELSAARAITVAKAIIESGVDPERITIQGHGEFRPLHDNSSPEKREANRRVEIALFLEEDREQDPQAVY